MNIAELSRLVLARLSETAGQMDCDDHFAIDQWEWPQGVALYALFLRYRTTRNPADLAFLKGWFDRGTARGLPPRNVNTTAPLLTLCCLVEETRDQGWAEICLGWAEWLMHAMPRTEEGGLQHVTSHLENPGELWADTLFMSVLFLAKAGIVFKRPAWVDEAAYQFLLHLRYLADPEAGLWFHGWTFMGRHHYGRIHWARGNAWFCLAAVEFLEMVEPAPAVGRTIREALACQLRSLAACQAPDGLWHTVLDDPGSYTETSASAAIAHACLKGIRLGLVPQDLLSAGRRAVAGVASRIDERGVVTGVSHGTSLGMDRQHYLDIPLKSTAYGQGLAFLMLSEAANQW